MPDLVAHQIADDILSQNIEPGTTLPSERELTVAYGVSRGTLREALRILESHGIVAVRTGPGGGPVVQPIRPDALTRNLSLLLRLSGTPLAEVNEARSALEPLTASLAAERATEEEVQRLQELVDLMDASIGDEADFLRLNRQYHDEIAKVSRNSVLGFFAATLSSINDGHAAGVQYSIARLRAINASHHRIFEAIRDHDPERAANEAKIHLQEFRALLERRYPELLTGPVRWMLTDNT
jgi:GntR family transcriptional repressor for pyruvate dehydrogenase complex